MRASRTAWRRGPRPPGRGGMGSVWEGRHTSLGTRVAIKFIDLEYVESKEACARFGQALWPRVELARVLVEEGRDWPAAEQALRAILAREPNHVDARRNLAILQQRGPHTNPKR